MATAAASNEIHVSKGTVLFRQGDPGNDMFVIAEGRVLVTLGAGADSTEIAVLGRGEFFGELSLLMGAARTATAEAIEDCRLLVISRDVFAMLVQDDLEIVAHMLSAQGRRLTRANRPIEQLARKMPRIRIIACALRCMGAEMRLPWAISLARLAADLRVPSEAVAGMVADLSERGAGTLRDGEWRIEHREHADKLIEALSAYAEEAVSLATPPRAGPSCA